MNNRIWFIVLLLVTIVCAFISAPDNDLKSKLNLNGLKVNPGIDLVGGAELTYRILFKSEDTKEEALKDNVPQKVIDILRKRLDERGLKANRITLLNDDQIVIQLTVQSKEELKDYKDLLRRQGSLEEREVATRDIHERWNQNPEEPPDGWIAIQNDRKMGGEYAYLGGDFILVSQEVIITGDDIERATKEQDLTTQGGWAVGFVLKKKGADAFDKSAKKLYNQTPRGLTAIIVDGKIVSKPTIQAVEFNGRGSISGNFDKESAGNLAIILSNGELPVEIGSPDKGEGEPEAERFIGPTSHRTRSAGESWRQPSDSGL